MAVLFSSTMVDPTPWREAIQAKAPGLEFRVFPELGDPTDIEVSLAWRLPPGTFGKLTNLKLIYCTGAGVDQLFADPELPAGIPIVRVVDDRQADDMACFVMWAVFDHHRKLGLYRAAQAKGEWLRGPIPTVAETRVGFLGLGALGAVAAQRLAQCGFAVSGWTRTRRDLPGVEGFSGDAELPRFLAQTDCLVCILPLTPQTENILNRDLFAQLPKGATIVNVARGAHLVDADLIEALESGQLSGATLDVFRQEPLPADHPFWKHPSIVLTPHIASLAKSESVHSQVAENIRRLYAGEPLLNEVDRARGY